ncbi:hypothetical protein [Leptolinea tardivitalis]|uniref:hypothetical protein n=1 Tax=Leptolinea tardivitalis TaxID=229920 RepID=UPI00130E20FC|nr:hypothetical protein [Leptolinea tardivitalis]
MLSAICVFPDSMPKGIPVGDGTSVATNVSITDGDGVGGKTVAVFFKEGVSVIRIGTVGDRTKSILAAFTLFEVHPAVARAASNKISMDLKRVICFNENQQNYYSSFTRVFYHYINLLIKPLFFLDSVQYSRE